MPVCLAFTQLNLSLMSFNVKDGLKNDSFAIFQASATEGKKPVLVLRTEMCGTINTTGKDKKATLVVVVVYTTHI